MAEAYLLSKVKERTYLLSEQNAVYSPNETFPFCHLQASSFDF
jgi:hypothetical protein